MGHGIDEMKEKYEKIKIRAGGKRAVVGIARRLVLRMRRMLLDRVEYVEGLTV